MTTLRAACFSDLGKVRKENEDRVLFDEAAKLFGVADGVGGLPGGGEAAQETVNVVTAAVLATPPDAELDLRAIVTLANDSVAALGMRHEPGPRHRLNPDDGVRPRPAAQARARRGLEGVLLAAGRLHLPDRGPFGRERGPPAPGARRGRLLQRVAARAR